MSIIRTAAAGCAAAIALAGLGAAGIAQPASASTVPVIYATFGSWQHPRVRPHTFTLGANWWLSGMRWSRWSSQASGHGTDNWSSGNAGRLHRWPSTVTLSHVKIHHRHRYYSAMKITSRGHRTIRLTYRRGGWFQS